MSPSFRFVISTPLDTIVGWFSEHKRSLGSMMDGVARDFTADVIDARGRKVLMVKRRVYFAEENMDVYAYPSDAKQPPRLLGKVEKAYTAEYKLYEVSIAQGQDQFDHLFQLKAGGDLDWTFSVKDNSGQERAVVSRRADECVPFSFLFLLTSAAFLACSTDVRRQRPVP